MPIQPGTDIGRYHILEQLGEGGMAVVYKAFDTRTETDVAIKFIRTENILPKALGKALKRFQIEAKKMAQLNHPNIVPVTDFGEYEGSPFLVMRYLPGGTLKGLMGDPLPFPQAVKLLIPIANALKYAHEQGVIHRDIKPGNILITQSGQPVLSDFGVAKVLESEETLDLTTTGMGVGTPEYMAPEQAEGKPVNVQADVYSLGIVFYELVTGKKPFTAETPMAVIVKQMHDPLPQPSLYNPLLPRDVEQVLFKALAKKPENRYANMSEMIQALESLPGNKGKAINAKLIARFKAGEKSTEHPAAKSIENYQPSTRMPGQPARSKPILIIFASLGILGMLAVLVFTNQKKNFPVVGSPQPIQSPQTSETPLIQPTKSTAANKAIPILKIGSTAVSKKDGMTLVYVPAGEFEMGSQDGEADEQPVHKVFLGAFWIDKTEVTNSQYSKCMDEGACTPPMASGSQTRTRYYGSSGYSDFPVVYVNWNQADLYCRWAGRELPTEAQWEKAARGMDSRIYPWGEEKPNSAYLNFNANDGDTTKVGSYQQGISPSGTLDMAGNVWEWTADWYDSEYYSSQVNWRNPLGPSAGEYHVQRGGAWGDGDYKVRSTYRKKKYPTYGNNYDGFRCALDAGTEESVKDFSTIEEISQPKSDFTQQPDSENTDTWQIGIKTIDEFIHIANTSTYDYKREIIPVGNISFDTNVRVNIEMHVNHEEQEGNSSSGLVLYSKDEKTKSEGTLYLVFQDGWWKLFYFINGGFVEGADFDYIIKPSQIFSLTINEDLKSVTITNGEGFTLSHTFKNQIFFGTKSFIAFIQSGPKGSIDIPQFSIDQN